MKKETNSAKQGSKTRPKMEVKVHKKENKLAVKITEKIIEKSQDAQIGDELNDELNLSGKTIQFFNNSNHRTYPEDMVYKAIENYKPNNYGELSHPSIEDPIYYTGETESKTGIYDFSKYTQPEIPYGKMSAYPEINLDKNWSREESETTETVEEKLDKILGFLNSIESELIEFNTPQNVAILTSNVTDGNLLEDMPWHTLEYLHKQSADTLNRLNFPRRNQTEEEEFRFAEKRFNKLNNVLKEKLNQINWD